MRAVYGAALLLRVYLTLMVVVLRRAAQVHQVCSEIAFLSLLMWIVSEGAIANVVTCAVSMVLAALPFLIRFCIWIAGGCLLDVFKGAVVADMVCNVASIVLAAFHSINASSAITHCTLPRASLKGYVFSAVSI